MAALIAALVALPPIELLGLRLICIAAAMFSQVIFARHYLGETAKGPMTVAAVRVAASWLLACIFLSILLALVLVVAA